MKTSLKFALLCTAGLAMAGCKQDDAMAPPGPGPTATPNTYKGESLPGNGSVNTESRMGSDHPMAQPAQPPG